jgi:CheY-like chemotaxis protein
MELSQRNSLEAAIAATWASRREVMLDRVARLQSRCAQLIDQTTLGARATVGQREALAEAHRLAGSLGTFGFADASAYAARAEALLREEQAWSPYHRQALAAAVLALANAVRSAGTHHPLTALQQARRGASEEAVMLAHRRAKGGRVLLIEDDDLLAELIVDALRQRGVEVDHVADGLRAQARLDADAHDMASVVVLDVNLPGRSGWSLLEALTERDPAPAVVMISARATEADELRAFELGAQDFVAKPLSLPVLVHRVHRALGCRRMADVR